MRPGFLGGVVVGVAGVWLYHRYVNPIPSKKG
jgi:hypothetical protein